MDRDIATDGINKLDVSRTLSRRAAPGHRHSRGLLCATKILADAIQRLLGAVRNVDRSESSVRKGLEIYGENAGENGRWFGWA